jgi:energy-converting hydrogenase A subunit R
MKFICFDLEGPLSPQDNAYQLMKGIPKGDRIFEVISRYDDLLTLEKLKKKVVKKMLEKPRKKKVKRTYEPGDTLALIVPFLIYHGISEDDMRKASQNATLINGARELVAKLINSGWWVGNITTCYEQYGYPITQKIGIPPENVSCTVLRLDQLRNAFRKEDLAVVKQLEKDILAMQPLRDDSDIKNTLDAFYWSESANPTVRAVVEMIKPRGGQRKVEALEIFVNAQHMTMDTIVVVGDSITDLTMIDTVNKAGGLAIAFNANEYALKYATMSLASVRLDDLWVALEAWEQGGRHAVERLVKEREEVGGTDDREWFHWLDGTEDITPALEIHRRIRSLVREEAAKLG